MENQITVQEIEEMGFSFAHQEYGGVGSIAGMSKEKDIGIVFDEYGWDLVEEGRDNVWLGLYSPPDTHHPTKSITGIIRCGDDLLKLVEELKSN